MENMENNKKVLNENGLSFVKDLAKTKVEISSILAKCEAEISKK